MLAGHLGVAAGAKSATKLTPFWLLAIAALWLDLLFIPLFAIGLESTEPAPGAMPGYGGLLIHANYAHSLIGAAVLSVLLGLLTLPALGMRAAAVISLVAFSHWPLDLIVHRADLPIWPGGGGSLRLGYGLWDNQMAAALSELAIIAVGITLYWRATRNNVSSIVLAIGCLAVLAADVAGYLTPK